jgi:hypothetical protein
LNHKLKDMPSNNNRQDKNSSFNKNSKSKDED